MLTLIMMKFDIMKRKEDVVKWCGKKLILTHVTILLCLSQDYPSFPITSTGVGSIPRNKAT